MSARLAVESLAARAAPALPHRRRRRRHDAAGKAALEARSRGDRRACGTPARRRRRHLGDERQDDDDGDGCRDPRAEPQLAWNRSGANLVSGVASTLLAERDAELGCSKSTRERCRRSSAASVRGQSCSATSSATSSTATASWSTSPSAGARRRRRCRRRRARRQRRRPSGRRPGARALERDRLRDRRPATRPARAPACGRLALLRPLRAAVRIRGRVRRPPRRLPLPACGHARPALQVRATEIELDGLARRLVPARDARGVDAARLPLPGLYTSQRARSRRAREPLGVSLEEILTGSSASAPPSAASS